MVSTGFSKTDLSGVISAIEGEYTIRLVESGDTIYVGKAQIGSATSNNVWRIKKLNTASGLIVTWADGDANFDNIWDNYLTLSYS